MDTAALVMPHVQVFTLSGSSCAEPRFIGPGPSRAATGTGPSAGELAHANMKQYSDITKYV